jgi:hypothetical protein
MHTQQADPKLEHVIVKTVCGFLNAEGGVLLICVADVGAVLGVAPDLSTFIMSNLDGYELFLRQLLDTNLSASTAHTVRMRFEDVSAGQSVCLVSVAASGNPSSRSRPRAPAAQTTASSSGYAQATPRSNFTATTWSTTKPSIGADGNDAARMPTGERCRSRVRRAAHSVAGPATPPAESREKRPSRRT